MIATIDHGPIRELKLDRPPANALSPELVVALRSAIQRAPSEGVRALILSGAPGKFSAGLDIPVLLGLDRPAIAEFWPNFYGLAGDIAASAVPIAAAITGYSPAGGAVLATFCDWRVMAEGDFKIGLNEVQVGIPLPPVILQGLRRLVGPRQAERLAVRGEMLSPQEAMRVGFVDELAPPEKVVDRAVEYCQRLLALPAEAMTSTRRLARADLIAIFEADLKPELERVIEIWWSPSTQAPLRALVERLGKKTG
ncbi:MAG: enoyl-CoA hydratase/isomerase family protein [Terriglobales bacterium]|jgi:enoyl-CoA hydratase/carnithine racemase